MSAKLGHRHGIPDMLVFALATLTLVTPATALQTDFFTLGAGTVDGGYFAAASAICERVNRTAGGAVRCSPDPTAGSIYNIDALRSGQIDFALVQSDWQRQAYEGSGRYDERGPMSDLRSVMGLYPEMVTILVREDAGIEQTADLVGRRIDIGHPASGRYATNLQLLEALELPAAAFAELAELPVESAVQELCAGRIDATLLIVGHPNAPVARALSSCNVILLPVTGPAIDAYVAASDDYDHGVIRAGTYPGVTADIPTFVVTATLVTREGVDPALIERMVSTVLVDLPRIAQRAPVLTGVALEKLSTAGLTAPLHSAAEAAYAAAGL
jgi:uncharacterized protein